jgi:hypothetical protein
MQNYLFHEEQHIHIGSNIGHMCAPLIHILVARNEHGHANLILATIKTTYIIKVTNMNMLMDLCIVKE